MFLDLSRLLSFHSCLIIKTARQKKSAAERPVGLNFVHLPPGSGRVLREESPRREGVGSLPDGHDQIPDQTLSGLCPFFRSEVRVAH